MEKEAGLVEEIYWAALVKPEEKSRSCNKQSCPPGILSYIYFALLAYIWLIANLIVTFDKMKKIFSLVEWNFSVKQFR